ncbi:hypothetical protein [Novosphingobium sp. KA1]|uniref:hypothetical protein n=1 Tax=Novosphingobium sp. (strain KA1) TaxID=164608 RepID=UPI001A8E7795|nr:hypothetical protein [Novosphingobium sp. KA1]QSR15705.1 hypothetical protein CA833_00545 [Novosphingobium sp. KA1]
MIYLLGLLFLLFPVLFAGVLLRWRKEWSRRRIVLVSASPLAALIAVPCLLVFVLTFTSTPRQCVIDRCDEDRDTALGGLQIALAGFVGGVLTAGGTVYLARRNAPVPEADIFT